MARPEYDPWVRSILRCPASGHELLDVIDGAGSPALQCAEDCGGEGRRRRYPWRDGIPVLLVDDADVVTVAD
ncbi:MAG: hypothetical protein DI571_00320 [Arsenicicoccus sp.]|uniref:Trm112 family protein n=1 Tax=Serinicoccus profundi TaxID=1078471 RepID=UPI000255ECCB|nr:hypothetical protein [Serinicoccus profundi]PZU50944.1 MAG: hypothetical protein DI571_00320 [Arsenicicoccus sp.]